MKPRVPKGFMVLAALIACASTPLRADDGAARYDLNDPAEPWRTSRTGITARVMPPYTPLARRETAVSCWGRACGLGALLPTRISSQRQPLLARPIALELKQAESWTRIEADRTTFDRESPDRIHFQSSAEAGPIGIRSRGWIAYDGFIRIDLELTGGGAATIEGLRLVFTFHPEASIFHHAEIRWGPEVFRRSPTTDGNAVSYPWLPLVWVGNHDVGLMIAMETWDGWTATDDAIRLSRDAEGLALTFNIVTAPMALDGKRTYSFGLLATPAKPMPDERWGLVIGDLPGRNVTTAMGDGGRKDVIACLWQRERDGAVLAVMANWADEPVLVNVRQKVLAGRFGPCVYRDALTGIAYPGPLAVTIAANGFRMVTIEPQKDAP